jgi:hypothetical protein
MPLHDWFVGLVSVSIGLAISIAAAVNSAWFFELAKPRSLSAAVGRGKARMVFGGIGLAFVALGVVIALGYRVSW